MKVIRTYLGGCSWCKASGQIANPSFDPNTTNATLFIICPVCNGSKTVLITETFDSDMIAIDAKYKLENRFVNCKLLIDKPNE